MRELQMSNSQIKELCLSLMEADTEREVITFLGNAGYWPHLGCQSGVVFWVSGVSPEPSVRIT
jgi:hypothetical protein